MIASAPNVGTMAGGIILYAMYICLLSITRIYVAEHFLSQRLYVRDQFAFVVRKLTDIDSGLQILTQIMIADITTLRWRGLVVSLVSAPFLVNAFVGSNISTAVIEHLGWRWGCKHVSSTTSMECSLSF